MFSNSIEGIDILKRKIPAELQHWHNFGRISELHYQQIFDDEEHFDYIPCIELILTDSENRYTIKMFLYNVYGDVSFDIFNGFGSGFAIDDLSGRGYERDCNFKLSSFENDNIDYKIYCERIKVELL